MTENEFERYQTAVQLKEKINTLEIEIANIEDNFRNLGYPRSESNWGLSITLNNSSKFIRLTSELFWECVDLVKQRKCDELDKYKEQFEKL